MQSITDQLTILFVTVDDFLQHHPHLSGWRRSPNAKPAFTDAEVLTIGLMQSCLGVATLKRAYQIIAANFRPCFPRLPSYGQWLARLHALAPIVGKLIQHVLPTAVAGSALYVLDSKPIPVCKPIRHGRVRLLREEGAYFGKSTTGWYFGFKLHTLVHQGTGAVLCAFLTPANQPDRDLAPALAQAVDGGILLADRAYQTAELEQWLAEEADLTLVTPKNCGESHRPLICSLRERVETTFSQLADRFVDRVRSRSFHGLWNTILIKMLQLNVTKAGLLGT